MEELEMVRAFGSTLDDPNGEERLLRVRAVIEREVALVAPDRARPRRTKGILLAAAIVLSLGGVAVASNLGDGAGVDDPPTMKIPYVQARIDSIESQLLTVDASTEEGAAKAEYLRTQLAAVEGVLHRLCDEAGNPTGC